MKYIRISSDGVGESHFDDVDVELHSREFAPPAAPFLVSAAAEARQMIFCEIPAGWEGDWHPTPAHQYFVLLSGTLEVEVSDGEVRLMTPGTAALLEDVTGKGHVTRVTPEADVQGIFIQLP